MIMTASNNGACIVNLKDDNLGFISCKVPAFLIQLQAKLSFILSKIHTKKFYCLLISFSLTWLSMIGLLYEIIWSTGTDKSMAYQGKNGKWQGSVGGLVDAPMDKVWALVTQSKRLSEWMPMIERCTDIAGDEGVPGYVRVVSGFMFPQKDGERSWIKEKLLSMDLSAHSYIYKMEASNVGLDGSINTLKLVDYGEDSTLIEWKFEINPLEGVCEESIIDYLGFLYKSCINRIEGAIEVAAESKQV